MCPAGIRSVYIERPSGPFDTPGFQLVATLYDGKQAYTERLVIIETEAAEAGGGGGVRIEGQSNPVFGGTMFAAAASFASTVRHSGATIIAPHTPSTSTEACLPGQYAWDANYAYVCVAASVWKRTALERW
eukprot:SAG22_NODE_589_length_8828_cov_4.479895_5_plen_131_part_00